MTVNIEIIGDKNSTIGILKSASSIIEIKNIDTNTTTNDSGYDIIIAGMGPAASIAAYKLAELYPSKSIAIISNGPEPNDKRQFYSPPNNIDTTGGDLPFGNFNPLISTAQTTITQLNGESSNKNELSFWAAGGISWINGSLVVSDERQYPGLETELAEVLSIIKAAKINPIVENKFYNDQSENVKNYFEFMEKLENIISNMTLNIDNKSSNLESLDLCSTINENDFLTGPRLDYAALLNKFNNVTKIYNKQVVNITNNDSLCTGVKMADISGNLSDLNLKTNGKLLISAGYLGTTNLLQQMILSNVPVSIPDSLTMEPKNGLPLGDETIGFIATGIIPFVNPDKIKFDYPSYKSYAMNNSDKTKVTYEEIQNGLVEFGIIDCLKGPEALALIGSALDASGVEQVTSVIDISLDAYYALCFVSTFQGTRDYGGSNYKNSLLKKENYVTSSAVNKFPDTGKLTAPTANLGYQVIKDSSGSDQQLFMKLFNWKDDIDESTKQQSYNNTANVFKLMSEFIRKMSQEFSSEGNKLTESDDIPLIILDISDPLAGGGKVITNNSDTNEILEKILNRSGNHTYHFSSGLVDFVNPDTLKVNGLDNVHIGDQSVLPFVFTNSTMVASQCMALKAAKNM